MKRSLLLASAAALAAATLSACVVVPIDPRTGQPYPYPEPEHSAVLVAPASIATNGPPQQSVYSARLYPLNVQANQGGLLNAAVIDRHTGRGSFTLNYLGDTLQGEATRVDGAYGGFGRIHAEVLGAAPRFVSGQRGIANAFGARGVNAQCEYVITGPALGTGVCLFSDGAKYQLHFGG